MHAILTGSRDWDDERIVRAAMERLLVRGLTRASVGDCKTGVDLMVRVWCLDAGIIPIVFEANWTRDGNKRAGPLRNSRMVAAGGDICVGFRLRGSRGTWDCLARAIEAGIETWCYAMPERRWSRLSRD